MAPIEKYDECLASNKPEQQITTRTSPHSEAAANLTEIPLGVIGK